MSRRPRGESPETFQAEQKDSQKELSPAKQKALNFIIKELPKYEKDSKDLFKIAYGIRKKGDDASSSQDFAEEYSKSTVVKLDAVRYSITRGIPLNKPAIYLLREFLEYTQDNPELSNIIDELEAEENQPSRNG